MQLIHCFNHFKNCNVAYRQNIIMIALEHFAVTKSDQDCFRNLLFQILHAKIIRKCFVNLSSHIVYLTISIIHQYHNFSVNNADITVYSESTKISSRQRIMQICAASHSRRYVIYCLSTLKFYQSYLRLIKFSYCLYFISDFIENLR